MKNLAKLPLSLALLICSGCIVQYTSHAELKPEELAILQEAEGYYLNKASEKAAFSMDCPRDQVEATVVSSIRETHSIVHGVFTGSMLSAERTDTVGVTGCGQKRVFQLSCMGRASYTGPTQANSATPIRPCDLIVVDLGKTRE